MMKRIENISIPKPCNQSWQQMSPAEQGRHCDHCSKTVIDFTKMTDKEIISHLSGANNVCGRFDDTQISSINRTLITEDSKVGIRWKRFVLGIGLLWAAAVLKVEGQTKAAPNKNTEQCDTSAENRFILGKVAAVPTPVSYKTITGRVIDLNKQPIIGAIIQTPNALTIITDSNGSFKLRIPTWVTQFKVNYIGFVGKMINITNEKNDYQVQLSESPGLTGEVVIVKIPWTKRTWHKIKRMF